MKRVIRKANKEQGSIPTLVGMLMLITIVASLMCPGYFSNPVWAADVVEPSESKIAAADGVIWDQFGYSVAISGDTAVVGACYDDLGASDQGSAYVFVKSGTNWTQQAHLIADDGQGNDYFGYSVAVTGDTAVVGACYDDIGANTDQGSAYVFVRNGTVWTQQARLTASGGAAYTLFGYSVAVSGDTVIVGAYANVGGNIGQGSAYVFVRSGTNWTQQAQLTASDGAMSDQFGCSVAISEDTVVVGAHHDDVGATDQGSAYVFVRSGTNWTQQDHLIASDGAADDYFGHSVALSGDTAVVGAYGDDVGATGQGSAYVFVRSGTNWTQQDHLIASDGAAGDNFGFSVAISGDTAVVGAVWDNVGATVDQGSAYVFVRSGANWADQVHLIAGDGAAADMFGWSVAISGDTVAVGAPFDDAGASTDQGSAYVYMVAAAEGGGGAQISATVILQSISVTISEGYPTAIDYGIMAPSAEAVPVSYTPGPYLYLRVENSGSMAEDLLIEGANATCGEGTWILAATPGADQYSHLYGVGQAPGSYSPLSTSASALGSNIGVGGTVDFNVKIQTPTSSTVWGQYSTMVTILAVAHLGY